MQMDITLDSVFASKKSTEDKKAAPSHAIVPSTFQVSAKLEEQSRKENKLLASFLLTLTDPKNLATYEFRGTCNVTGSASDFDYLMESGKGAASRLPRMLDIIYQRVYPAVFMLAGMTSSSYPQSTTLMAEAVHQPEPHEVPAAEAQASEAPAARKKGKKGQEPKAEESAPAKEIEGEMPATEAPMSTEAPFLAAATDSEPEMQSEPAMTAEPEMKSEPAKSKSRFRFK